jgi:hypothetical protein
MSDVADAASTLTTATAVMMTPLAPSGAAAHDAGEGLTDDTRSCLPIVSTVLLISSTEQSITTLTFEDGTWQLDTTGMDPCGYVVHLETYDRTIVDSSTPVGWTRPGFVGFCLKK